MKEKWHEESVLLQVGERRSSSTAGVPAREPEEPVTRSSGSGMPADLRLTTLRVVTADIR